MTGGNGGIGLEVSRQLARDHGQRFHVLIGSRRLSDGEDAVGQLRGEGLGAAVEAIQVDITSEESLAAAARLVGDKFGRLDVLHANASTPKLHHCGKLNLADFFFFIFIRRGSRATGSTRAGP